MRSAFQATYGSGEKPSPSELRKTATIVRKQGLADFACQLEELADVREREDGGQSDL
jgi:hypothetical protein